jgi:hypothetical protein
VISILHTRFIFLNGNILTRISIAPDGPLPTAAEIIAAIPPEGISMTNLVKKFASSKNKERVQQLVPLIRRTAQVSQGQVTRKP